MLKKNQAFWSISKIQDTPINYIYRGIHDGLHFLESADGVTEKDCFVDKKWFANRTITNTKPKED